MNNQDPHQKQGEKVYIPYEDQKKVGRVVCV